jgi:hypothetical protein
LAPTPATDTRKAVGGCPVNDTVGFVRRPTTGEPRRRQNRAAKNDGIEATNADCAACLAENAGLFAKLQAPPAIRWGGRVSGEFAAVAPCPLLPDSRRWRAHYLGAAPQPPQTLPPMHWTRAVVALRGKILRIFQYLCKSALAKV